MNLRATTLGLALAVLPLNEVLGIAAGLAIGAYMTWVWFGKSNYPKRARAHFRRQAEAERKMLAGE